ncbi:FecR family protein [Fulvivirga lutea]|uniref:FecR domain-containing protein n=1 Tax=Fulvivirga lutea TaxID=2810512 RepID=A0A974WFP9_9BACT|nr:FecR family protein [Fulvivirga lutea]QSE96919.1 FecR domain-containing protein [Fulvivirga lutea]
MKLLTRLFVLLITISSCSNVTVETKDNYEVEELPDGSLVYLNHNSSLEYDQSFDKREVNIKGELYFSVVKGASPFVVKTELGEVKVLGTEFNVNTNEDELDVEVEEGTVELSTNNSKKKVKRGQSAKYKKGNNGIQLGKAKRDFNNWLNDLEIEFKKLGKEIKKGSKEIEKESKKAGKAIDKELKKLKLN